MSKSLVELVSGVASHKNSLAYHIHKVLTVPEDARSLKRIHASDLTDVDFCPRFQALMVKHKIRPKKRGTFAASAMVWKQGRLLARGLIEDATTAGIAVGNWLCAYCDTMHYLQKKPNKCVECGGSLFFYKEVRVKSKKNGGSCGIDLLLKLPGKQLLHVVEIKSMDKEKFKELKLPLAEHRERTQFYLRCIAESDLPGKHKIDTSVATIFYISKGGFGVKDSTPTKVWKIKGDRGWMPFKEFTIHRDDEATQPIADRSLPLHNFLEHGGPLPDRICPSIICSRAQWCEVADKCFEKKT